MAVLGLNHGEYNSSAALVVDGRVVAGAAEERFSRAKRTRAFPRDAVKFCLGTRDLELEDIEAVGQAWNPGAYWEKFNPLLSGVRRAREDYLYSVPDNLLELGERRAPDWIRLETEPEHDLPATYFVNHHLCHAAAAFYASPFDEAAIFTADWRGELQCGMYGVGHGGNIEVLDRLLLPNSLGLFYATFTELLGYRPDNDEWKVMALSAFDVDASREVDAILRTLAPTANGWFELDQTFYKGVDVQTPHLYTGKLVDALGGRIGQPGEEPDEWHMRVARAMQIVSEQLATSALAYLHEVTELTRVVLGGGFFMNSVFNGRIAESGPFEEVFVPFAPADLGNSLGVALYVEHAVLGRPRAYERSISSIGPDFSEDEIKSALDRRGIAWSELADPVRDVACLIREHHVIGYFDGKMEFGERALGNRSILADPSREQTKDAINSMIKYREAYRPFAPIVTFEAASDIFAVPPGTEVRFMEKVVPMRPELIERLPAVAHVDGSARVQTLIKADNPRLYGILETFAELAGFPVLLNTSFNVNGEPIVCTPDDALTTFFNSGLRCLVLGNYVVTK